MRFASIFLFNFIASRVNYLLMLRRCNPANAHLVSQSVCRFLSLGLPRWRQLSFCSFLRGSKRALLLAHDLRQGVWPTSLRDLWAGRESIARIRTMEDL